MDPHSVLVSDPDKFNSDLESLMDSAAAAAVASRSAAGSDPVAMPRSPPKDPRLRNKRAAPESSSRNTATKKVKRVPDDHTEAIDDPARPSCQLSLRLRKDEAEQTSQRDYNFFGAANASALTPFSPPPKTLRRVVRRQWNSSSDDIAYEDLLQQRRTEKLENVDRYVPPPTFNGHESMPKKTTRPLGPAPFTKSNTFRFSRLPGRVKDKILAMLLVKDDPIIIDFTWLRAFITGHSRVPSASRTVTNEMGQTYSVAVPWPDLYRDVSTMQMEIKSFKSALELRGNKTRAKKSPCRGLTTGLLQVSRAMHARAAPIFYGQNTFHFPWATSAWMQLESFLLTIGDVNAGHLRNLGVHVPLWHRGLQEDYVEGAMLDLTSPASRMAVLRTTPHDRLLSAIETCVHTLKGVGVESLSFDLEHGMTTDRWTGRYNTDRQLIAMGEAEAHVVRKQKGIALLKKFCNEELETAPLLSLHHPSPYTKIQKHDKSEFRSRFLSVRLEAEKYGWKVEDHLKDRRW